MSFIFRSKEVIALEPILSVQHLNTVFTSDFGTGTVVDDVSFNAYPGQTLCIVGESGCGKSVTCLSVMGLLSRNGRISSGDVIFNGKPIANLSEKQLDRIRGSEISMIFQDALTSLNPVFTIGNQLMESIRIHMSLDKKSAKRRALALLEKVGLPDPENTFRSYPHTLSGGQRQRVMIAMALSCDPKLLIADEPTTALDVTIQKQIMKLLQQLQKENGMSIILITHDMGLVAQMADQVLVMYAGQVVEEAPVMELFHHPSHPYTQLLLKSVPSITDTDERVLESIQDSVPEHYQDMQGCRFRSRCPFATEQCGQNQDMLEQNSGHFVRCHLAKEVEQ